MMLYFLKGRLPWRGLKGVSEQQKYQLTMDRKAGISLDELCSDVREEFRKYTVTSGLWTLVTSQIEYDYVFDWTILKYIESLQGTARGGKVGSKTHNFDSRIGFAEEQIHIHSVSTEGLISFSSLPAALPTTMSAWIRVREIASRISQRGGEVID